MDWAFTSIYGNPRISTLKAWSLLIRFDSIEIYFRVGLNVGSDQELEIVVIKWKI